MKKIKYTLEVTYGSDFQERVGDETIRSFVKAMKAMMEVGFKFNHKDNKLTLTVDKL